MATAVERARNVRLEVDAPKKAPSAPMEPPNPAVGRPMIHLSVHVQTLMVNSSTCAITLMPA